MTAYLAGGKFGKSDQSTGVEGIAERGEGGRAKCGVIEGDSVGECAGGSRSIGFVEGCRAVCKAAVGAEFAPSFGVVAARYVAFFCMESDWWCGGSWEWRGWQCSDRGWFLSENGQE